MTDMTRARAYPGRHFPAMGRTLGTAGVVPPLNKIIALPFDAGGEFDAISVLVKFGGSGDAVLRAGIYSSGYDGLPATLLAEVSEHEVDTPHQGQIDMLLPEPIYLDTPYWVAAVFGGDTAPTMLASAAVNTAEMQRVFGVSSSQLQFGLFSGSNAILVDQIYGSLPEEFPSGHALSATTLWLSVRSTAAPSA